MQKIRPESLQAALVRGGCEDEFFDRIMNRCEALEEVREWLAKEGIKTSIQSISRTYRLQAFGWRIRQAKAIAVASVPELPADHEQLRKIGLEQRAFELAYSELTAKDFAVLARIELQAEKQKLEAERLALDKEKFALLKSKEESAKRALGDGNLTAEDKMRRLREVFGIPDPQPEMAP